MILDGISLYFVPRIDIGEICHGLLTHRVHMFTDILLISFPGRLSLQLHLHKCNMVSAHEWMSLTPVKVARELTNA